MGDLATLAKARKELEDLYLGIPDDSVNLTFKDFAEVKQQPTTSSSEKKKSGPLDPISEASSKRNEESSTPSLDFSTALEASTNHHHRQQNHHNHLDEVGQHASRGNDSHRYGHGESNHANSPRRVGLRHGVESSMGLEDERGGGRRRAGIPHSNICTICSVYVYVFRYRCLVCGRVYCRQCVTVGMGEMTEGRKCIECLGRKFSQRYIQRAGKVGWWVRCCMKYPNIVKQHELKWAEKGPRRSGENRYGQSGMVSRSRSPMTPRTPTRAHAIGSNSPSFVINSPYSPYSPTNNFHLPL